MEVQDSETNAQKIKSERYGKIAIALFLLLALSWAIGAFVIWILLGAAAYFTFLYFYYQPRQPKVESWRSSHYESYSANDPDDIKKKAKLVVQIVIGFFVFLFAFFFVVGIVSRDDAGENNTIISDASGESTNDTVLLLKDDPDNIEALTGIGNQFFDQSNYDSALFYYDKVLRIEPANSAALYNKGLVFYNLKQYEQSIDLLKKCLGGDPANRDAKYIMGHDYYDRQLYDDALNWYQQAYEAGLRDAFLSHALGFLYDNKGNNTLSIRYYKEALQMDSSRATIYTRLAEMEPDNAAWYRKKEAEWKK